MDIVPFGGWDRNARLVSGPIELIVTLEVGPRVLFLGRSGGPNLLYVIKGDAGRKNEEEYRFYGGHRLWIAPESEARSMQPENVPPAIREEGGAIVLTNEVEKWHVRKEMRIEPLGDGAYRLDHRITNESVYGAELALWAPTQCAPGGEVIWPQAPHQPHTENLLPTRPLVMWAYTKLADPRYEWGERIARLRQDASKGPTKVGTKIAQGYAAYALGDDLFVKKWSSPEGVFPDMGCDFETFTNQDMIEIETLGPLVTIAPGATATHTEFWRVFPGERLPEGDAAADRLADLAASIG